MGRYAAIMEKHVKATAPFLYVFNWRSFANGHESIFLSNMCISETLDKYVCTKGANATQLRWSADRSGGYAIPAASKVVDESTSELENF